MVNNKHTPARYAFIGLIVAVLGCVATGLLALVQGTVALGIFTPPNQTLIPQWIAISAGVLILGLAAYAILNPEGVRRALTGRQARYGSNAAILAIAFVGILVVVNILVYQNPWRKDFTEDKQHTLAPETIQTLAALPGKVEAIAFFSPNTPRDTAEQLLNDLKGNSRGKFDYRFVDPNAEPVLARQYGITGDGKIVLVMGKATATASFADESDVTQAMLRLINPQAHVIYFLTGHGEPDISSSGGDTPGLSQARQTLQGKNYLVKTLNLAATHKIPDDAKALVEAGPTSPMLPDEVSLIQAYLAKGGSLIVLENSPIATMSANPASTSTPSSTPDPLADYLKNDWGIMLNNDLVIDFNPNNPTANGINAISASVSQTSPITQHSTLITIMPEARSLTLSKTPPPNVSLESLVVTAPLPATWGETDFASLQNQQKPSYDPNSDFAGPLTLAASAINSTTNSRVVVFGDAIFATDAAANGIGFGAAGNGDMFVNAVDWAAQQDKLINLTPHPSIARTFNPPGQFEFILILLGSIIVIPGLIVAAGVSNWVARRRRG